MEQKLEPGRSRVLRPARNRVVTTIRQILFVPPAPLVWADHLGLFGRHGLDVETTPTLSSDQIGRGLAEGTWDIGIGVMDDVIEWNNAWQAKLKIAAQLERSIVMRFCCVSSYADLEEAAANIIAVDSTTHGFALVLYRALARIGIDWRRCRFEALGGVKQRFDAMRAGKAAASILVPPFDDMARAEGFKVLWNGEDISPDYPGAVAAVREPWLARNADAMRRYLAALLAASDWAARPGNAAGACAALMAQRYSESAADRLVREIVPDLVPSLAGWTEVLALRRECGLMPVPEPDAADVIDPRPLTDARAGL